MFQTVPLSIIRSFSLYTHSNVICHTEFRPDPARKLSPSLYDIHHCCVYSEKTYDDGQRNCPKHVKFYYKNKLAKLVHLVGFIIRIESNYLLQFFSCLCSSLDLVCLSSPGTCFVLVTGDRKQ